VLISLLVLFVSEPNSLSRIGGQNWTRSNAAIKLSSRQEDFLRSIGLRRLALTEMASKKTGEGVLYRDELDLSWLMFPAGKADELFTTLNGSVNVAALPPDHVSHFVGFKVRDGSIACTFSIPVRFKAAESRAIRYPSSQESGDAVETLQHVLDLKGMIPLGSDRSVKKILRERRVLSAYIGRPMSHEFVSSFLPYGPVFEPLEFKTSGGEVIRDATVYRETLGLYPNDDEILWLLKNSREFKSLR
jgi:hypothetical protein